MTSTESVLGRMNVQCPFPGPLSGGKVSYGVYTTESDGSWTKVAGYSDEDNKENFDGLHEAASSLDKAVTSLIPHAPKHMLPSSVIRNAKTGSLVTPQQVSFGGSLFPSLNGLLPFLPDPFYDGDSYVAPKTVVSIPIERPDDDSTPVKNNYRQPPSSHVTSAQRKRPVTPKEKRTPISTEQKQTDPSTARGYTENGMQTPLGSGFGEFFGYDMNEQMNRFINDAMQQMKSMSGKPMGGNPMTSSFPSMKGENSSLGEEQNSNIIVDGSLPRGTPKSIYIINDSADPPSLPRPRKLQYKYEKATGSWVPTNFDYNLHKDAVLERHNLYRDRHQVDPLQYSIELSKMSQRYANQLCQNNVFKHSENTKYGENLAMGGVSYEKPPYTRVDAWYNEIKYYSFTSIPRSGKMTGHFTQLVWKNSKKIGIGICIQNGRVFLVCNYDPPGNVMGQYKYNVFPVQKQQVNNNFYN